jgi:large subunit ribosomal protein L38
LEQQARQQTLMLNLDVVKTDWLLSNGQQHIRDVAKHYGVYEHLFGKYAIFTPRVPMNIEYKVGENQFHPVHYGNLIKPSDAEKQPDVSFDATIKLTSTKSESDNTLWSLLLTNPDGHLQDSEKEYVHWFISNIPNGDISKGETIVPYLQPFPAYGTGYHRHIFILYKQDKKIDFSSYKVNKINDLEGRTFTTFDFYKTYQDVITPAGLSFFQSSWEKSLTDVYHKVLDIKEPKYEYDFAKPYIRDQTWFPLRQPFNLYLDKYRDPKEIAKEFVERKLANTHPFNGPKPPLRFPNAHSMKDIPSWLKTAKQKSRLGKGRILDY